jgi:hypothetical protein
MSERDIDALVRDHLARQAQKVDPAAILSSVKSRQAPPRPHGRRFMRRASWLLAATAAAVALGMFGGIRPPRAQASPESLVRDARQVYARPADRCYKVVAVPDPDGPLVRLGLFAQIREPILWTRGDRFWFESTNPKRPWSCGRQENGDVWVAAGRKRGVRFERDEIPDAVALACDAVEMRVDRLLDEVLAGFDLRREPGAPAGVQRIRAVLRPGRPSSDLLQAVLDVDESSRVLRRLELHRAHGGRPLAKMTFTLVETRPQPDGVYQIAGHLDAGAPVFDRNHRPLQRGVVLMRYFGLPLLQNLR